ncbi:unnamed protein product [Cunninghamella blakesleeana]
MKYLSLDLKFAVYVCPPIMLDKCPYTQEDFFQNNLDENQRKAFLAHCPKNQLRNYIPPKLPNINIDRNRKQIDNQLINIQYRLSGITRPLDWFTYQLFHNNWNEETTKHKTLELLQIVNDLLADSASYISQLRTENAYKAIQPSILPPQSEENYLFDTKDMLEHFKLQQSVNNINTKRRTSRSKPRRYTNQYHTNHTNHTNQNSNQLIGNSASQPTNQQSFIYQPTQQQKQQPNKGFQIRLPPKKHY